MIRHVGHRATRALHLLLHRYDFRVLGSPFAVILNKLCFSLSIVGQVLLKERICL